MAMPMAMPMAQPQAAWQALPVISAFRDFGPSDLGLVSSDIGLVLQYINKSVYAFEIIIVVVCTYCLVSMVAVKKCCMPYK